MSFFSMNSGQTRARLVQGGAGVVAAALIAGCGSQYRPVVTPITPSGPQAQPASYAITVSAPSPTSAGIATVIDYAGDSVLALAPIGPGPEMFTIDEAGATGYTLNSDGTLSNFPISATLQAKQVFYTTLPSTSVPASLYSPAAGLYLADLSSASIDVFSGFPQTFKLGVPVGGTPISIVGPNVVSQRAYAISQPLGTGSVDCNNSPTTGALGSVSGMEISTFTLSSTIPVGKCPVYAVESSDFRRLFVMNRGDDTISVINSQNNTLDSCVPFLNQSGQTTTCHPVLPLSTTAVTATGVTPPNGTAGMAAVAGPVYAEYNATTQQLVVANYDGSSVSVIDVSEDIYGNDSATFGTTFTIPVGANPASVTMLADGTRAYTANQTDGTVSVVEISSHTLEKTLAVTGHPRTVVSTQNSLDGKVYVASPDSPYLTILRTDQDIVDTTVLVEGNIVDVRVTTQNGTVGNTNVISRRPGYGQPCNLPGAANSATLVACQVQP